MRQNLEHGDAGAGLGPVAVRGLPLDGLPRRPARAALGRRGGVPVLGGLRGHLLAVPARAVRGLRLRGRRAHLGRGLRPAAQQPLPQQRGLLLRARPHLPLRRPRCSHAQEPFAGREAPVPRGQLLGPQGQAEMKLHEMIIFYFIIFCQ
jgi:hypothetical protein